MQANPVAPQVAPVSLAMPKVTSWAPLQRTRMIRAIRLEQQSFGLSRSSRGFFLRFTSTGRNGGLKRYRLVALIRFLAELRRHASFINITRQCPTHYTGSCQFCV